MKQKLKFLAKKIRFRKAIVLMYHRVECIDQDIWDQAVTPANFEAQLKVLKKRSCVVSVPELIKSLKEKSLTRNSVAITFDDGYVDNYLYAKPLLEKYNLPATFFITSGNIGVAKEFWWDELEQLLLDTPCLPKTFSMSIYGTHIQQSLEGETDLTDILRQKHRSWKASTQIAPTARGLLYQQLWQALRPLKQADQQELLYQISIWAGRKAEVRSRNRSMTEAQLQSLASNPLFTIGAHTVSHPALFEHSLDFQQKELEANKMYLQAKTGKPVEVLAYPYGNFSPDSATAASNTGMAAAFSAEERPVYCRSRQYDLGRFEVNNWDGTVFEEKLRSWFWKNF